MVATNNNWYQDLSARGKRYVQMLGVALLAGLALSSFAFAYSHMVSGRVASSTRYSPRQISMNGEGKVTVRPDTAVFTASVITQFQDVTGAREENSARSEAIMAFLREQGIEEKDIKTIGYNVSPQYQYDQRPVCLGIGICPPQRPPTIVSYEIRHTIEIKVRDLAKANRLLDGVTNAGANEVGAITFRVDDEGRKAARAEARAKAIADAEIKAWNVARELGVRLVRISAFYESEGVMPYPMRYGGDVAITKGGIPEASPSVQPGENEIISNVTIGYEFR